MVLCSICFGTWDRSPNHYFSSQRRWTQCCGQCLISPEHLLAAADSSHECCIAASCVRLLIYASSEGTSSGRQAARLVYVVCWHSFCCVFNIWACWSCDGYRPRWNLRQLLTFISPNNVTTAFKTKCSRYKINRS